MLEDTNSLDGAQIKETKQIYVFQFKLLLDYSICIFVEKF